MQSSKTLYSVHGLRFFAAFSVAVHHSLIATGQPAGSVLVGAAGVDVFFVISGLVIGLSDFRDGAARFFIKRLIRVIPLYWIATVFFIFLRIHQANEYATAENIIRSLFLLPRYGENWTPIYFPAWTLVFEMFFYLTYAAALTAVGRHVNLVVAALMIFLATLHIPVPFVPGAHFRSDLCLEFATGILIAQSLMRGASVNRAMGGLLLALSLLAFALNAMGTGVRAIEWGLPAAMLVGGVLGFESWSGVRSKILVLGGNASYAIYLFQLPAMAVVREATRRLGIPLDDWGWVLREVILLGAVVLAGLGVHLLVEKPVTGWLRQVASGRIRSPFARPVA